MGRRLVVGLGNPGPEYESTWHNMGFAAVRALAKKLKTSVKSNRDALLGRGRYAGHDVFLCLPQTYMNRSGNAVARVMKENRIDPEEVLVIYDDHDLPRGRLRMRGAGGDGGHRGLRSILSEVGTGSISRLRIGIRDEQHDPNVGGYEDLADRVLDPLTGDEKEHFLSMADAAAQAAVDWLAVGTTLAMNRNNRRIVSPPGEKEKKRAKRSSSDE